MRRKYNAASVIEEFGLNMPEGSEMRTESQAYMMMMGGDDDLEGGDVGYMAGLAAASVTRRQVRWSHNQMY